MHPEVRQKQQPAAGWQKGPIFPASPEALFPASNYNQAPPIWGRPQLPVKPRRFAVQAQEMNPAAGHRSDRRHCRQ